MRIEIYFPISPIYSSKRSNGVSESSFLSVAAVGEIAFQSFRIITSGSRKRNAAVYFSEKEGARGRYLGGIVFYLLGHPSAMSFRDGSLLRQRVFVCDVRRVLKRMKFHLDGQVSIIFTVRPSLLAAVTIARIAH